MNVSHQQYAGRALPQPEFAAKHLTELDEQVLMHLYHRIDFQQEHWYTGDFHRARGLPSLIVFESA